MAIIIKTHLAELHAVQHIKEGDIIITPPGILSHREKYLGYEQEALLHFVVFICILCIEEDHGNLISQHGGPCMISDLDGIKIVC